MRRVLRQVLAALLGVALAIGVIAVRQDDALSNLRFHTGLADIDAMKAEAEAALRTFDKKYVAIFTSGGDLEYLRDMPAANLVKRRIVQDLNSWTEKGRILSHDRMAFEISDVEIFMPDRASVVTAENWSFLIRDLETGKRISGEGGSSKIRGRYILQRFEDGWKVIDFIVYDIADEVPPVEDIWRRR